MSEVTITQKTWDELKPEYLRLLQTKKEGDGTEWQTGEFLEFITDLSLAQVDENGEPNDHDTMELISEIVEHWNRHYW